MNKYYEFKTSSDIYRADINGKEYLVRSGVKSRISLNLHDILSISEVFKEDGTIYKTKCIVHHIEIGKILLSHKYKEIKKIREEYLKRISRVKVKGFTR